MGVRLGGNVSTEPPCNAVTRLLPTHHPPGVGWFIQSAIGAAERHPPTFVG